MTRPFHLLAAVLVVLFGSGAASEDNADPLAPGTHALRVSSIVLWYRVAGRPDGTPVVFLHGGPGEGRQVFQAIGGLQLEKDERMVYFDQRGAGRSDRPKDPALYSMDLLVEDIERLRVHLGVEKIVLLGHSFGTQLALEYAARHPDHTEALVLASATPDLLRSLDLQCEWLSREDPEAYRRARDGLPPDAMPRCNTMRAYSGDAAAQFARRNLFPNPTVAARVDALDNADGLGHTGEAAGALFQRGLLTYRFTRASDVTAPVLVIAGGEDRQAAVAVQRDLVKALPHGRLLVYPMDGHFMFVDEPDRFARDAAAFLRPYVKTLELKRRETLQQGSGR